MAPQIDNYAGVDLNPDTIQVLRRIFARYKRVRIIKEFTAGLSGSRVFEVRAIKADGTPELPTVVKVASVSMIEQEWQAYRQHIQNRLPRIAGVTARPTMLAAGWGGLRYPAMGSGSPDIQSLSDYYHEPDLSPRDLALVLERLLHIMDNVWGYYTVTPEFVLKASYARKLPPQLVVRPAAASAAAPATLITPAALPAATPAPGGLIALSGFVVRKVDLARRTVTLDLPGKPARQGAYSVRLRVPEGEPMPPYRLQEVVDLPAAVVLETCEGRLRAEAARLFAHGDAAAERIPLAEGVTAPNPLSALPELLDQKRSVHVATIHGDFNLQNILIEPQLGEISLIDFAEARQDHVLHDLLHLEVEILTNLLPEAITQARLDPLLAVAALNWHARCALSQPLPDPGLPTHPALQKPWVMLAAVRRAARNYLFHLDDPTEYFQGLTLYLLGALRFKNLDEHRHAPLPKQIAFWSATLAYSWLTRGDELTPPPELELLFARGQALWAQGPQQPESVFAEQSRARGDSPSPDLSAIMPLDRVPPVRRLPAGSRVPLERNSRFVGREEQLKQLAAALKGEAEGGGGAEGERIAVVGLGGIGKSQLACEFAHRYGHYFAGGVFWLSCADPNALVAEIAACGGHQALGLRPNFHDLPLEEQAHLVGEAWAQPVVRLLIFDNCEDPALLARWAPRSGGCRVLVTSRRADWKRVLALDVLRRSESVALLLSHHPDVERELLTSIAHELGDLPLALHLAGSYLARYRHSIDAASYLRVLREASPLSHQSLQRGARSPTEHDLHVARTFAFSYDQLVRDDPTAELARMLLHGAACLAPGEPIPESLARLALRAHHEGTAAFAQAGFQLGSAIAQLLDLGLMRIEANHTLWLHRLVAAFTRECLGDRLATTQASVERAMCAEAKRLNTLREPLALRGWQVHLRFVTDAALPRGDAIAADLCHAFAEHLYQVGDFHGASVYHQYALGIHETLLGPEHPSCARALTQLGKALFACNEFGRARSSFERALALQRTGVGTHPDTATTLNHLGYLLQLEGELDAAGACHQQALDIWRLVGGAEHPAIVDSLSNLAYVAYKKEQLGEAYLLLQQAIEVQRRATGEEHLESARLLTNMGELLVAQRKPADAGNVFERALAIQERELGPEHPETARTLCGLGDVQRLNGDLTCARRYYQQALRIFELCHGPAHPRSRRVQARLDEL